MRMVYLWGRMEPIFDIQDGKLRLFPATERRIVAWYKYKKIRKLIGALNDKDLSVDVRALAAIALGRLKDGRALNHLIEGLDSGSLQIRRNCVVALGDSGLPEAVSPLLKVLSFHEKIMRMKGLEALGALGGEKACRALLDSVSDADLDIRTSALIGISRSKIADRCDILIRHLKDPDKYVRSTAARCLGKMKEKDAIGPLLEHFEYGGIKNYAILEALGQYDPEELGEHGEKFRMLKAKEANALRSMGLEVEDELAGKLQ